MRWVQLAVVAIAAGCLGCERRADSAVPAGDGVAAAAPLPESPTAAQFNARLDAMMKESGAVLRLGLVTAAEAAPEFAVEHVAGLDWAGAVRFAEARYTGDRLKRAVFLFGYLRPGQDAAAIDDMRLPDGGRVSLENGEAFESLYLVTMDESRDQFVTALEMRRRRPASTEWPVGRLMYRTAAREGGRRVVGVGSAALSFRRDFAGLHDVLLEFDQRGRLSGWSRLLREGGFELNVGAQSMDGGGGDVYYAYARNPAGRVLHHVGYAPNDRIRRENRFDPQFDRDPPGVYAGPPPTPLEPLPASPTTADFDDRMTRLVKQTAAALPVATTTWKEAAPQYAVEHVEGLDWDAAVRHADELYAGDRRKRAAFLFGYIRGGEQMSKLAALRLPRAGGMSSTLPFSGYHTSFVVTERHSEFWGPEAGTEVLSPFRESAREDSFGVRLGPGVFTSWEQDWDVESAERVMVYDAGGIAGLWANFSPRGELLSWSRAVSDGEYRFDVDGRRWKGEDSYGASVIKDGYGFRHLTFDAEFAVKRAQ